MAQSLSMPLYPSLPRRLYATGSRSSSAGSTAEPSMIRSVPSGSPGFGVHGNRGTGVDFPEKGSNPAGQPNPRLLMSPVRTTRSASGPFTVRSYLRAQSWSRSPLAAAGVIGAAATGEAFAEVAPPEAGDEDPARAEALAATGDGEFASCGTQGPCESPAAASAAAFISLISFAMCCLTAACGLVLRSGCLMEITAAIATAPKIAIPTAAKNALPCKTGLIAPP